MEEADGNRPLVYPKASCRQAHRRVGVLRPVEGLGQWWPDAALKGTLHREGKQRLVHKLEAERAEFVREHLGAIAASREHDAYTARDALIEALDRIEVADSGYAEVAQWYSDLLRPVPGVYGRDIPSLDLSALKNEVLLPRLLGAVTGGG